MGQNEKMDFGFNFHKVLWDHLFISAVVCYYRLNMETNIPDDVLF